MPFSEKNKPAILFITNSDPGQSQAIFAVAHELLIQNTVAVHIASFPALAPRLKSFLETHSNLYPGGVSSCHFHALRGRDVPTLMAAQAGPSFSATNGLAHAPGIRGALESYKFIDKMFMPSGEEYMERVEDAKGIIEAVAPALVVLEPLINSVATDACAMAEPSPRSVMLDPIGLVTACAAQQPWLANLWRFPATSSGYPFPIPWSLFLANIFLHFRLILTLLTSPVFKAHEAARKHHGIPGRIPIFAGATSTRDIICPSLPELDWPFFVPKHVHPMGPITLPVYPVEDTDPKLAAWLARKPTVLICLGSWYPVDVNVARETSTALRVFLQQHPEMQVLWKLKSLGEDVDAMVQSILDREIEAGDIKVVRWLEVDPQSILCSGHVVCSVNHGGANSFYEALAAGIPQVILPAWYDCYDQAQRVEYLGIGIYGNKKAAPGVSAEEFGSALQRIVSDEGIKRRAMEVAGLCGRGGGGREAAKFLVGLVADGEKDGGKAEGKVE